ncbi:MAG: hypothetical protein HQK77_00965 [Desulfobacterales bacterium]|nr:hypothetical protein [Desulfobacterales bacterium]
MKKRGLRGFLLGVMVLTIGVSFAYADGQIKLVANTTLVENGEALGVSLLMSGSGFYDVYAGLTGGIIKQQYFLFTNDGGLVPFIDFASLPKLRENLNMSNLFAKDKVIHLLPKLQFMNTKDFKGNYLFFVALCTPGQLDFVKFESITIDIQ